MHPHVIKKDIYIAYQEMATDEMRESEALEWTEATFGDINYEERWVDFNPPTGAEIQKKRPAVIISNNTANQFFNRVQVIPLTSNADKLYPSETYFTFKGEKAMTDQLTMVSKHRLTNKTDTISKNELEGIMQAIAIQLDL